MEWLLLSYLWIAFLFLQICQVEKLFIYVKTNKCLNGRSKDQTCFSATKKPSKPSDFKDLTVCGGWDLNPHERTVTRT